MSKILRLTSRYTSKLLSRSKKPLNQSNIRYITSVLFQKHSKTKNITSQKYLLPYFNKSSTLHFSTTVNVPNMGDSISEGTLVEWTKNVGDQCEIDDIICVIETDKVSIDVRTDYKGVLTEQLANIDDTLEVGAPLFIIDQNKTGNTSSGSSTTQDNQKSAETKQESKPEPTKETQPTTKATESKPTETKQTQTTDNNNIKKDNDIPPPPPPILGDVKPKNIRQENIVAMTRIRQKIASRLKEAQNTSASLTTFNEIDMSNIINLRNKYKEEFEKKHGVKLGFMSAFVSASTKALLKFPAVNAYIAPSGKEIIYHDYTDISVAVASPTGLVVPVLRNTESMSFADIEKEIQRYAGKAKNGTLSIEDMSGGTFTISNGGVFGSLMGTPIINPPQSAILGMHGTFQRPVAINNEIKIKPMMYIALTYDHRIIDGREAVLFLRTIKDNVEDPARLVFDI